MKGGMKLKKCKCGGGLPRLTKRQGLSGYRLSCDKCGLWFIGNSVYELANDWNDAETMVFRRPSLWSRFIAWFKWKVIYPQGAGGMPGVLKEDYVGEIVYPYQTEEEDVG